MKTSFVFAVVFLVCTTSFAQSIFDNPITGTNPNTFNPYTIGQTVNANLTASGIGRGSGITGSAANNRYTATQWNSTSLDANDYFEFTITPNAGKTISFTSFVYTGQASGTGPLNFSFRSSVDGYTTDIGSASATGTTISLSNPLYQNITTAITFHLYGWNASSGTGTFSVNDFTFNGVTAVLPVTIAWFNAVKQNGFHLLNWKVDCTNSAKALLEVERSNDAVHFNSISSITADATRCLQPFSYMDQSVLPGNNYYRLKMTDAEGNINHSNVVVLANKSASVIIAGGLSSILQNNSAINITAAEKTAVQMLITDATGKLVQQNVYHLNAGINQVKFNCSCLAAGIYQLSFYTAGEQIKTIRLLKQ